MSILQTAIHILLGFVRRALHRSQPFMTFTEYANIKMAGPSTVKIIACDIYSNYPGRA